MNLNLSSHLNHGGGIIIVGIIFFLISCVSKKPISKVRSKVVSKPRQVGPAYVSKKKSPPLPEPPKDVKFPVVKKKVLKNGFEVLAVEYHELPVIYLRFILEIGSMYDPSELPGLGRLVANMLREGTRKRSSEEIAEEIESLGAELEIEIDPDYVEIRVRGLKDHLKNLLEILSDMILHPIFPVKEFKKLLQRERDRLTVELSNPTYLLKRELQRALYREHPYSRMDISYETLTKVKRRDLKLFWQKNYVPSKAFLVVAGDIDLEGLWQEIEKNFAIWKEKSISLPSFSMPPLRQKREVIVVDRPGSVQSSIMIGNIALSRNDPEYIQFLVANQIIGGGASSRLFMNLREQKGYTYGAYSYIMSFKYPGIFYAWTQTQTKFTTESVVEILKEFEKMREKPAKESELKEAKAYLSGVFPIMIETPGKIATMVALRKIYNLPEDYWDTYRSMIEAVTLEDVLKVSKKYINPNSSLIVVVGKADEIKDALQKFGPLTVISPHTPNSTLP
jgi:zinc protease